MFPLYEVRTSCCGLSPESYGVFESLEAANNEASKARDHFSASGISVRVVLIENVERLVERFKTVAAYGPELDRLRLQVLTLRRSISDLNDQLEDKEAVLQAHATPLKAALRDAC